MTIQLEPLLKLHNPGILAFICRNSMKVYLVATNSMLGLLQRYIQGYYKLPSGLEVQILEEHSSIKYLKYRVTYWNDLYIQQGFSMFLPITLTKYHLVEEYNYKTGHIDLYIRANNRSRSTRILIQSFDKMDKLIAYKEQGIEAILKQVID